MSACIQKGTVTITVSKQLQDIRQAEEDWTGKGDAKERRKIQNRLHQRAWRRRKLLTKTTKSEEYVHVEFEQTATETTALDDAFAQARAALVPLRRSPLPSTMPLGHPDAGFSSVPCLQPAPTAPGAILPLAGQITLPSQPQQLIHSHAELIHHACTTQSLAYNTDDISRTPSLLQYSTTALLSSCPLPQFHFPLSPDHYLLTLIQYNVLRAIMSNLHLCSLLHLVPGDCAAASLIVPLPPPSSIPPSFAPTSLQLSVIHRPYLDTIPCPKFRDNLILANSQGLYDEDEFCDDLCGGLWDGYPDSESRGLLVWDEPWRAESWEASKGFVEKWGWLLKGCDEMLAATNRYREARGEERLVLEIE